MSHIKFLVVLAEMKYHCISPSELLGVLFISSNIFKEFFFPHQLNGHEFEQTPGDSEGQGSLVGCSPWSHKELDTT